MCYFPPDRVEEIKRSLLTLHHLQRWRVFKRDNSGGALRIEWVLTVWPNHLYLKQRRVNKSIWCKALDKCTYTMMYGGGNGGVCVLGVGEEHHTGSQRDEDPQRSRLCSNLSLKFESLIVIVSWYFGVYSQNCSSKVCISPSFHPHPHPTPKQPSTTMSTDIGLRGHINVQL